MAQQLKQPTKDLIKKIDQISEGYLNRQLKQEVLRDNALTIANYMIAQIHDINPAANYKSNMITTLIQLSTKLKNKPFKKMTKDDILFYLDGIRKPELSDPLHRWIGTYNESRQRLVKFFRWLFNPNIPAIDRTTPEVVSMPKLKRKETSGNKSCYKPTDLWTKEEDLLFVKYCRRKMDACYHMVSRDASTRPHEILDVKIKDIFFKTNGDRQYAEIVINGKTGTRAIPLIDSLPYLKDWMDNHPQQNREAYLFISMADRAFGQKQSRQGVYAVYSRYKKYFSDRLLNDAAVPEEDKIKIRELLRKPWNPYIRRHTALTEKSRMLKTSMLKMHAGWSPSSQMNLKYEHWFGNESNESILEAYGIVPKDKDKDVLQPKQCPQCNEPNKPDSKFCAKCRMVLTYDAYSESIEEKQVKDQEIENLKGQMKLMQEAQKEIHDLLRQPNKLLQVLKDE